MRYYLFDVILYKWHYAVTSVLILWALRVRNILFVSHCGASGVNLDYHGWIAGKLLRFIVPSFVWEWRCCSMDRSTSSWKFLQWLHLFYIFALICLWVKCWLTRTINSIENVLWYTFPSGAKRAIYLFLLWCCFLQSSIETEISWVITKESRCWTWIAFKDVRVG